MQFLCFKNLLFTKYDLNITSLITLQTFKTVIKVNMNFTHIIIMNTNETKFYYDIIKKINIFNKMFLMIDV